MIRQARRWTPAVVAVVAGGASTGAWTWLLTLPTARVLLPDGEVGYLHAAAPQPLLLHLALGVVGVALVWGGLGLGTARWRAVAPAPVLQRLAPAYLPLVLLLVDASRLWLPLGRLSSPVAVLTYEGRWPLAAAVGLAVAVLHARALAEGRWRLRLGATRLAAGVFLVVLAAYLAFVPRALLVGPTGDEPDYLLLAHSLLTDWDFDLRNNLEAHHYRAFTGRMTPHVQDGPGGGLYDTHRLGLPLLIAPAYGLGRLVGWPVRVCVVVFLALLAALVAARTALWAAALTGHPPSALLAALGMAWGAPGFFYAYAIFPEVPVGLVVLELLRRFTGPSPGNPWLLGTVIATLPWFHEKFVPLTAAFTGLALWGLRRERRAWVALGVPLVVSALLQAGYYVLLYGRPFPLSIGEVWAPATGAHGGFIGLWLDRDHGLLTLAPLYLLASLGLPALFREQRQVGWMGALVFASLYAVVASTSFWWGGFAPAPRYLVPVVPLLGLALAFGIREALARRQTVRVLCLAGASVWVATYAVIFPALLYRHAHPLRSWLTGVDWTRYLPSWVFADERTWPLTGLAIVAGVLWAGGRGPFARGGIAGLRLTASGALAVLVVMAVVLTGDALSGTTAPHLTREDANRELLSVLSRRAGEGRAGRRLTLHASAPVGAEPLRLVYEAERLPGQAHETIEDPLAANGFARTGGRAGIDLVFGPYETLPPGAYRAVFRLRGEPGAGAGEVATLGVSAARGRAGLGVRAVRAEELTGDAYRDLAIEFTLAAPTSGVEWRVRPARPAVLRVDRITVVVLDPRVSGRQGS